MVHRVPADGVRRGLLVPLGQNGHRRALGSQHLTVIVHLVDTAVHDAVVVAQIGFDVHNTGGIAARSRPQYSVPVPV